MIKNFGLIILCPKYNDRELKITLNWVGTYMDNILAVLPPKTKTDLCSFYCANSLGDMINLGMQKSPNENNLILLSGCKLKSGFYNRLDNFINSELDIIYPITTKYRNFVNHPFVWLVVNKKSFVNFGSHEDFDLSKLLWINDSRNNGCNLKGLVGVKASF